MTLASSPSTSPDSSIIVLLLRGASERGAKKICVHVLTNVCDVLDGSSVGFSKTLENELSESRKKGIDAQVASGGGRIIAQALEYEKFDKFDQVKVSKNLYVGMLQYDGEFKTSKSLPCITTIDR
ncbi:hypothetical protein L2E82_05678 [Cichorium intybus]|uniref:Uncharacterized protein n=1 Tax=Cichorium intybus TaxID=13427 RepID=A0ACB9H8Z9_CICIN|nr:hypothetical protein L2E82_05678 [Cichorium intybus]